MQFINNDNHLISGLIDGSIILVDVNTTKIIKNFTLDRKNPKPLDIANEGNTVNFILNSNILYKFQLF